MAEKLKKQHKIAVIIAAFLLLMLFLVYLSYTGKIKITSSGISIGEGEPALGEGAPTPPTPTPTPGEEPTPPPSDGEVPPSEQTYPCPYSMDFSALGVWTVSIPCPEWAAQLHAAGIATWCYRLESTPCMIYNKRFQIISLHNYNMVLWGWEMMGAPHNGYTATGVYWEAQLWKKGASGYIVLFIFRPSTVETLCSGNAGVAYGNYITLAGIWNTIDWAALV